MRSKKDDIHAFIKILEPDIIIGTETKIESSILTCEILPPNYNVMRKDRNKDGGGVMIALKGDIVASHRPDLDDDEEIL